MLTTTIRGGRLALTALAVFIGGCAVALTAATGSREAEAPATAVAAFNAWLQIPGVNGEAIKRGHENWIQVIQYGWAVEGAPAPAQRGGVARPTLPPLRVTKYLDRASPILAGSAAEGKVYPEAQLVFYGAAGTSAPPLGVIRMTDVRVAGTWVESDPAGGSVRPTERVALSFGAIEWSYNEIVLPEGTIRRTISAGWNVARNRPVGDAGGE